MVLIAPEHAPSNNPKACQRAGDKAQYGRNHEPAPDMA
jgi:hypothetical protein